MYLCECLYVCVYVCAYVCVRLCILTMFMRMHLYRPYTCVRMYAHMCGCVFMYMYECMFLYVCMFVYVCMCKCVCDNSVILLTEIRCPQR